MSDELVTVFLCFLCLIFGVFIGGSIMLESTREEAINAGAAHWSIDPETGEKTFVFQPPPTTP